MKKIIAIVALALLALAGGAANVMTVYPHAVHAACNGAGC